MSAGPQWRSAPIHTGPGSAAGWLLVLWKRTQGAFPGQLLSSSLDSPHGGLIGIFTRLCMAFITCAFLQGTSHRKTAERQKMTARFNTMWHRMEQTDRQITSYSDKASRSGSGLPGAIYVPVDCMTVLADRWLTLLNWVLLWLQSGTNSSGTPRLTPEGLSLTLREWS